MLPRILEPEVMDSLDEAVDYDAMDHSEVNRLFVDDFLAAVDRLRVSVRPVRAIDVGTGTAQIPIELCRRADFVRVTAVDLASHMLQIGQRNVIRAGLETVIRLEQIDAKGLPYGDGEFSAVVSNSIVHHIPEPLAVVREMRRVLKAGGILFIRDLLRPADVATLDHLVASYAGDANAHQRQMFRDSLHAALTLDEVRGVLAAVGLPGDWVTQTSDRHWTIAGAFAG
jgi:ubiquinone/menaquinone biosynthesis C-methylase UbiE